MRTFPSSFMVAEIRVAEVGNLDVPCTSSTSTGLFLVQRLLEHVAGFWQISLVYHVADT